MGGDIKEEIIIIQPDAPELGGASSDRSSSVWSPHASRRFACVYLSQSRCLPIHVYTFNENSLLKSSPFSVPHLIC